MKQLLVILACLCVAGASARQADSARMYDRSKKIFIEPLALIDGYNKASLRVGVEWPVLKDFCSVFGMVGLYPNQPAPYYSEYVRAGIRIYGSTLFRKSISAQRVYVSVHFFVKSQWFTVDDNLRDTSWNPSKEYVSYDVKKRSYGFHLEVGNQYAYKHLCVEPFIGIGVRQSTVVNSASDSLQSKLFHFNEDQATNVGNSNKYNAVLPSITMGIRLSYLFKTKAILPHKWDSHERIKRMISGRVGKG